ncbi:MAG: helix-turn-helix domain-containing protein [Thiotrichales bacterium]|nr:helix-turn-helix domain-containing protein [Thiotrichales bacterium]
MNEKINTFNLHRETIKIIFENKLSKNEILILLFVARRMGNSGEKVYFQNARVAKNFGVSPVNISKSKSALKKKGFIIVDGYFVSMKQLGSSIPFENEFFNFVSNNSFSAAQLKALIFIGQTSHQVRKDKKTCYISKTKFNRDTGSSQAVIIKVLRMLCANKMLVKMKVKTEANVDYYRNLSFSGKGGLVVTKSQWKINFNGGKTWKKGCSDKCKSRCEVVNDNRSNNRSDAGQIEATNGLNNCSDIGQISSMKAGQISSQDNSITSSLLNDSPKKPCETDNSLPEQDIPPHVQDSSLTIVNDNFNEQDDYLNKLREKEKKSELSKTDRQFLDLMEEAIRRKKELDLYGGV